MISDHLSLAKNKSKKELYESKRSHNRKQRLHSETQKENDNKEINSTSAKKILKGSVKFVLQALRHYSFRQHLINKCEEYGCKINVVTEEYTSKTCGNCGYLSENYTNRIKYCSNCKLKINRDINGARNILIKNIDLVIKSIILRPLRIIK
jgi:transposase